MDEHIFQLVRDDELNDSFRISVVFKEDTFNLTVLQKLNAWTATVDKQNIEYQAKQLEVNGDEYYRKVQEYISKTPTSVDLKFINNELVINCKLGNKMKIKYFSQKLKKAEYIDCVENLMEKLNTEKIDSQERLKIVSREKTELEKSTDSTDRKSSTFRSFVEQISKNYFEIKLSEFIEKKKTDEQELYNNFVLVLNEKKKRIQHLSELLEAFKCGRPTLNPHVEVKKRTKKTKTVPQKKQEIKEEIPESDSDQDNYNTDEEKPLNHQDLSDEEMDDINKTKTINEIIPSTSKCDYNILEDDSPPRHHLPKRIKSQTSADNNNCNKPSTSHQSSENNNDKKNITYDTTDETPNVNFNTQDLLDNM